MKWLLGEIKKLNKVRNYEPHIHKFMHLKLT